MKTLIKTILIISIALFSHGAFAASEFRVPKIDTPVKIDAVLNEAAWQKAVKIDANIEVRPGENVEAPVRTEALIAYDTQNIYVAIKAYDPDPSQIRARLCDRDNLWDDDWVLILFDTFNDNRRSYDFFCNPLGIQGDMIETAGNSVSWDAIWDSEGRITDEGYIVEMAIPFNCMSFQPGGEEQVWSFDVVRSYPRKVRHHIGSFERDRNNNCYMCQAHQLIGFEGVEPGRNIELAPTVSSGLAQERPMSDNGSYGPMAEKNKQHDFGITGKWGITPNMTLSFTANPDFSQIEADAAQMDINTRFPLYYSEKRPFFLENADFFKANASLVHTRTLAEPEWGVKLSGKSGRNALGVFIVRDSFTPLVFSGSEGANNTTLSMQSTGSVVRYKRDVGKSSYVGLILTDREGDFYHNRVGGIDANIKFTEKDQINVMLYGSNTMYPDTVANEFEQHTGAFGGSYYELSYHHTSENLNLNSFLKQIGDDFRTDLGFMTQTGYRLSILEGSYTWCKDSNHWYNSFMVGSWYEVKQDNHNNLLNSSFAGKVNYCGPLESYFYAYSQIGKRRYNYQYFRSNETFIYSGFKPAASMELQFMGTIGDRIDYANTRPGKVISMQPGIKKKIGSRLTLNLNHSIERLNVSDRRLYTANVSNFKVTFQFNRRMFIRSNFQFCDYRRNTGLYNDIVDSRNNSLFSQLLFSYKINPQTVFLLGYSDNYGNRDNIDGREEYDRSLIQKNRAIFTKVGYAFEL